MVSRAIAINNQGQIAGSQVVGSITSSGPEPVTRSLVDVFLYENGTARDLGRLGIAASPIDINESGEIVGSYTTNDTTNSPFVYRDGQFEDLSSLIDPRLGLYDLYVKGINDAGQILAGGTGPGPAGSNTTEEGAFLLTPVPEPGALILVIAGAPLLLRTNATKRR